MSPKNEDGNPYMRPVDTKSKCERFGLALWNKDEKTLMGRTAKGWGLLAVFYTIFYSVLAAMFAVCMYTMLQVLPKDRPMFMLSDSLIGTNPGMGFRPQFLEEGSLIWYNAMNETQVAKYVNQIDTWLNEYTNASYPGANRRVPCDFTLTPGSDAGARACAVDTSRFGPCSRQNLFGYKAMTPCIFIKLNRIYNWIPEYYTRAEEEPSMPTDLKDYINSRSSNERQQVWISCKGENPGDREGLNYNRAVSTNISYYPTRGIPWFYFPYTNQPGYVTPTVAVQFQNLEPGRIINVRCRAWAKNIMYSQSLKEITGSTHIELMVDNSPLASS